MKANEVGAGAVVSCQLSEKTTDRRPPTIFLLFTDNRQLTTDN
jgi:hypothetical protein